MKVLLLNGANPEDTSAELICAFVNKQLTNAGHQIYIINLTDENIAGCLGCFGCWVKTPGECVIKDQGQVIAKKFVRSELVVAVTPVTFGGYSYQLKKALDRLIPVISPFFQKIEGEVHHKPRYDRYPNYLAIGIVSGTNEQAADTFRNLVRRNAINMHNPISVSGILSRNHSPEEMDKQIKALLKHF